MTTDLAAFAKDNGIKYFMITFTDLFGYQRAKLVPAQVISDVQKNGAGFAGFATWMDMTPAHPDMLAVPDPGIRGTASLAARGCLGCKQLHHGRPGRGPGPAQRLAPAGR